jgi:phosphonate transport system ATP-binding protein
MIRVRQLTKSFDSEKVLAGIDFDVHHGEFIVLLGASGSGKSTLFRCLTLQESWDKGEFSYNDKDVLSMGLWEKYKFRKDWAYLADKPNLNENKTAVKNVLGGMIYQTPLWRTLTGRAAQMDHYDAMDYLNKVGLSAKGHQKVGKLSGGEKQRVALSKALVQGAKVIIADEPISGLDPASAEEVVISLQKICQKERTIVLCSIQQVELAERYASRIWGISDGKLVVDITGRQLTQKEKNMIFN